MKLESSNRRSLARLQPVVLLSYRPSSSIHAKELQRRRTILEEKLAGKSVEKGRNGSMEKSYNERPLL